MALGWLTVVRGAVRGSLVGVLGCPPGCRSLPAAGFGAEGANYHWRVASRWCISIRGPEMRDPMLQLDVQSGEGTVVVRCDGELDVSVVGELRDAISGAHALRPKFVCIDARGLSFIDSSGLRCLIEARQKCETNGVVLEVLPGAAVARLLDLTGTLQLVTGNPQTFEPA